MKKTLFTRAFTLIELLVVISIIAILAGIALPVFSTVKEKGNQTKDLANGKQIGLALRLYSTDNEGRFPKYAPSATTGQEDGTTALADSNVAFRYICPTYVPTEKTFYLAGSGWTDLPPDEATAGVKALVKGENQFAYCPGLTDTSNPGLPLVADGFSATPGKYPVGAAATEGAKGAVWKGKKAIVIRTDASGGVESINQTDGTVIGVRGGPKDLAKGDLFEKVDGWLPLAPINPL